MEEQPREEQQQLWRPSEEEAALIEELLASDNELDKAYGEAYQAGCFVTEFGWDDGSGITAVGEMSALAEAEKKLGREIDPTKDLTLGECIELNAHPGTGDTRVERIRDGLKKVHEDRGEVVDPDALDLYGSFTESGYRVEAYMPSSSVQSAQWIVKVYEEGESQPIRELAIPMTHEPVFGVDEEDRTNLEEKTEELMDELTADR